MWKFYSFLILFFNSNLPYITFSNLIFIQLIIFLSFLLNWFFFQFQLSIKNLFLLLLQFWSLFFWLFFCSFCLIIFFQFHRSIKNNFFLYFNSFIFHFFFVLDLLCNWYYFFKLIFQHLIGYELSFMVFSDMVLLV
jgi:hypothetical protein